jgi:hypothetical protein
VDAVRVLVTASRRWPYAYLIQNYLTDAFMDCQPRPTRANPMVVVHGGAQGGDLMAARWVNERRAIGWAVDQDVYPVTSQMWTEEGKSAGPRRNQYMVDKGADLCLAFIYDDSAGAARCADMAQKAGIETVRIRLERVD